MRIKRLQIDNFKSLVNFGLKGLKPFCAFIGPNASGKSNIFEALEFTNYYLKFGFEAPGFFGGYSHIYTFTNDSPFLPGISSLRFNFSFDDNINLSFEAFFSDDPDRFSKARSYLDIVKDTEMLFHRDIRDIEKRTSFIDQWIKAGNIYNGEYEQFIDNFSRIFVGNGRIKRTPEASTRLSPDASNLAQIIGVIFENEVKRNDFIEWLGILIPEFKNIEVKKSNIDGSYDFSIYEKGSEKPFSRNLISDGTYNILSLMAAVYQSNQPQFLCIEEPENGLHPQAIELLVDFFRQKCEEEGHHIWLNTHSQTLVRCLEIDEIILVNKVDGITKAKQLTKDDEVDIRTDEAWLSNALGGGVLWSK